MSYINITGIRIIIHNCCSKVLILIFFLIVSCTPTIYYLGDSYPETDEIDVFYDEKDIKREYSTIGQMTHDKIINYSPDEIKKEMILSAKKKGADGIIFSDMVTERENEIEGDRISIKAKLIKYINKD